MTSLSPLQHALDLHRKGDLAQAIELYRRILAHEAGNADAHYYLAAALCQRGDLAAGAEAARQAVACAPDLARGHNLLGLALLRMNRPAEALSAFDAAILRQGDLADAHGNRASALAELGRHAEAIGSFDRAVDLRPDSLGDWCNRAASLLALGRGEDAVASYDQALVLAPAMAQVHLARATALMSLRRHEETLAGYDRALALEPHLIDAMVGRGRALQRLGRDTEALTAYDAALARSPDHVEARLNRGVALGLLGRHADANAAFERVLLRDPGHADALMNSGNALLDLERFDEALARFDALVARRPDHVEALVLCGVTLAALDRHGEALSRYDSALAIEPGNADALIGKAAALRRLDRRAEARAAYDALLERDPEHVAALLNRGMLSREDRKFATAAADFRRLLAREPDHLDALGELASCQLELADWSADAITDEQLIARVRSGGIVSPLAFVCFDASPADQFECAKNFSRREGATGAPRPASPASRRDGRIRLAYLSADFCRHVMASHMAELFELHDRARFEVVGISFGPDDGSDMRRRIAAAMDRFHDVRKLTDRDLVTLLHEHEIDIAIDLMGYTAGARPGVLRQRAAPVQVGYLGFPGTMAVDFIDYFIADPLILPFDEQPYFSERIVHLPDCYQVNDRKRAIAEQVPPRAALGLPEDAFVFCSFNNSVKIRPPMFAAWMRLLATVPDSVLWLYAGNETAKENLRASAARHGIARARIVFAGRMELEEHLARHRHADLGLDTLPYNGHGTTSIALWAGLPVVTCIGRAFAGRVGASLVKAIGLPELVTTSLADYEALALTLARDRDLLAQIRAKLVRNRLTTPLFDTDRFRRHIEDAYTTMHEQWRAGGDPRPFAVAPRA